MVLASFWVYLGPYFLFSVFFFSRLLREQWIRAKYERKEFIHSEKQEPYSAGRERHLWQISFFEVQHLPFSSSLFICSLCWLLPTCHWVGAVSVVFCTGSLLAFPVFALECHLQWQSSFQQGDSGLARGWDCRAGGWMIFLQKGRVWRGGTELDFVFVVWLHQHESAWN